MSSTARPTAPATLSKNERLCSRTLIEQLFAGKRHSIPAFPLRVVYMEIEQPELATASVLISVPKKRFKRAVKRNRVKRQIREAYRRHKTLLTNVLKAEGKQLAVAFIWLDNTLHPTDVVERKVVHLLRLIAEKLPSHE